MAKISKALVSVSPRGLSTVRTVDAKAVVLRPEKSLTVQPNTSGGQLTTVKPGGKTVVVSSNQTTGQGGQPRREGSGEIAAMADGGRLPGLLKATDAVSLLVQSGVQPGLAMERVRPLVLSMGNKRKKQTLANGTMIQRRLAGTGFDGANNKGFSKGRGSQTKQTSGSAGGGTSDDPFSYVTKKRSKVGEGAPGGVAPSNNPQRALPASSGPAALPGKAQPLQLGDKVARPGRSAAASGFVTNEPRVGGMVGTDTDAAAGSSPIAAPIDTALRYVKKAKRNSKTPTNVISTAIGLRLDDAKAALKAKDYGKAVKLFFADSADWFDQAEQLEAQKLIEKGMR